MQKILSKYGTAIHLAILTISTLLLSPLCSQSVQASVLLWLSLFTVVWVLFAPSRRSGESLHESRVRVLQDILRDPVFWSLLTVTLVVFVRALNDGIRLAYDAEHGKWDIINEGLSFIPGCLRGEGFLSFATMVALTVVFTGCRHSLGKRARFAFLFALSSFATFSSFVSLFCYFNAHEMTLDLCKCSLFTSSYSGTAFGICFLGGLFALVGVFECGWNKLLLLVALAACGPLTGLYFFAPTPVICYYLAAGLFLLALLAFHSGFHFSGSVPFKCAAALMIALVFPILCIIGFASKELNEVRLMCFQDIHLFFEESYFEMREILSRIASEVWSKNPWVGSGIATFPLDIRFHATPADWTVLKVGQAVSVQGWWHMIAERGIVGVLLYVIVLGSVFYTLVFRLCKAIRRHFYYPPCVLGPFVIILLAVQAFYDVSFLRPDVTLITGAYLALACSTFPDPRKTEGE